MGSSTIKTCKYKGCKEKYYAVFTNDSGFCDWHNKSDQVNRRGY